MFDITVEYTIYLILLAIVVFGAITIVWFTLRNGISPMPTGPRVQRAVSSVLAEVKPQWDNS